VVLNPVLIHKSCNVEEIRVHWTPTEHHDSRRLPRIFQLSPVSQYVQTLEMVHDRVSISMDLEQAECSILLSSHTVSQLYANSRSSDARICCTERIPLKHLELTSDA
jgi:hypothetical protein